MKCELAAVKPGGPARVQVRRPKPDRAACCDREWQWRRDNLSEK